MVSILSASRDITKPSFEASLAICDTFKSPQRNDCQKKGLSARLKSYFSSWICEKQDQLELSIYRRDGVVFLLQSFRKKQKTLYPFLLYLSYRIANRSLENLKKLCKHISWGLYSQKISCYSLKLLLQVYLITRLFSLDF